MAHGTRLKWTICWARVLEVLLILEIANTGPNAFAMHGYRDVRLGTRSFRLSKLNVNLGGLPMITLESSLLSPGISMDWRQAKRLYDESFPPAQCKSKIIAKATRFSSASTLFMEDWQPVDLQHPLRRFFLRSCSSRCGFCGYSCRWEWCQLQDSITEKFHPSCQSS